MADEVVIIYHGEIMEAGTVSDIFRNPQHPYLKGLLRAVPHFDMAPASASNRFATCRSIPRS